jgi:putative transposase
MKRYQLQAQGYDFDKDVDRVAKLFTMRPEGILSLGKQPQRVRAGSLVCYWAVKELGMNGTRVARFLGVIQSSVRRAVRRGERLALDNGYRLEG